MKTIYISGNKAMKSEVERFMTFVEVTDGCWTWGGALDRKGYGRFSVGPSCNPDGTRRNSMVAAHRFSFEAHFGRIDPSSLFVLHRCDNPCCVNPEHLFLGTNADNVHDMDSKGRRVNAQLLGSKHGMAKLNESIVTTVVNRVAAGESQASVARSLGVTIGAVNHVMTGRNWSHLTGIRRAA